MKSAPPLYEDARLAGIHHCVGKGLRKLIPVTQVGWPAYTEYGVPHSEHDPGFSKEAQEYIVASLWITPDARQNTWSCVLQYCDGDDWLLQRWRPFVYEAWCDQVRCYNDVTYLDYELVQELLREGFS